MEIIFDHFKIRFGAAVYPFNADQFVIFNVAVGGNWPGSPDENTTFPQKDVC